MLNKISINIGVIFITSFFFLLTSVFYTMYNYSNTRRIVINGVDNLLKEAAYGTILIIGEDYHDRVKDKTSISSEEYMANLNKLSTFAKNNNLVYVYTMIGDNENIYFTSTNATDAELKDNSFDRYYTLYQEPSAGLKKAFKTGEIVFDEYTDNYGTFRSVFIPVKTPKGREYVVGADMSLDYLKEQLASLLRNSILIGLVILVLGILLSIALSVAIIKPLNILTKQADSLSLGDNIDQDISSGSFKEIANLANSLDRLRVSLNVALKQMQGK